MRQLLSLFVLVMAFPGCVSVREARRYGEVKYWTGKLAGSVEGFERGRKMAGLGCSETRLRTFRKKLDDLDRSFEALAEESAKETDLKLRDRIEELMRKPNGITP